MDTKHDSSRRAPSGSRHAGTATRALLVFLLGGSAFLTQAQSVAPNRYGTPAVPPVANDSALERQQKAAAEARRSQDAASRRAEQDRIGVAVDANRQRLEADRARTERQRTAAANPAESERMRLDFEQRRQAAEREREELERQRAASEARPAPPEP